MTKIGDVLKGLLPLAVIVGIVAGVVVLAMSLLGGGDDEETSGGAALARGPAESSWAPGQKPLTSYQEFAVLFERALPLAEKRRDEREEALKDLERRKIEAKKRAEAEARRKYLEAKRRAELAYKRALAEAERKRREQLKRIAAEKRRIARLLRERAEKLKVRPGDECRLANVRQDFECETGKLPDPASEKKD